MASASYFIAKAVTMMLREPDSFAYETSERMLLKSANPLATDRDLF